MKKDVSYTDDGAIVVEVTDDVFEINGTKYETSFNFWLVDTDDFRECEVTEAGYWNDKDEWIDADIEVYEYIRAFVSDNYETWL